MTSLIACLSTGKGTWIDVMNLLKVQQWDKVFLITNEFGRERFKTEVPVEFIVIDPEVPLASLVEKIRTSLDGRIMDLEVAVNLTSGSGKEHMALLSAVLKLGLAMRYVYAQGSQLLEV